MKLITSMLAVLVLGLSMSYQSNAAAAVIEVVTLKLKLGISATAFDKVDHELQTEFISKRAGFLSRESAPGSDNSWVVIVHWRSMADADASMANFESAAAASEFMSMIEPGSMIMKRYGR